MAAHDPATPLAHYPYAKDAEVFRRMDGVIRANLGLFRKAGVLSVRPGYKSVGGFLTRKPAIVVSVVSKHDVAPAQELPAKVGEFAVDVREATAVEKLRAQNPLEYARVLAGGRGEYVLPEPTYERDPSTGAPLAMPAAALMAGPPKTKVSYTPAAGVTLDAVDATMAITCHASPDAGWPQLKSFFGQVQTNLTVGLYDFTSKHVLDGLTSAIGSGSAALTLTLDHPTKNPTADQTDEQTVGDLQGALDHRLTFAWALDRSDPKVTAWIYPSAYHIKVAVRDHKVMWLSSGNWNNSNQPDIDPLTDPAGSAAVARKSDRDWHIIVEHAGLSKVYEAFLKHDNEVAKNPLPSGPHALAAAAGPAAPEPDLAALDAALLAGTPTPKKYFAPLRIPAHGTRKIRIQPILTPDNYHAKVLSLIKSADTSFYMQTQYIHPSDKAVDQDFADLISAVVALQHAGKDVRVILSQYEKEGDWLDRLQATGMDLASVKIQTAVHNKGIVVDSKVVMLGSQNWSGDGVLRNRDASLIVHDADAAAYYEQIFLHDWVNMSKPSQ
jgi:hypothetical protein